MFKILRERSRQGHRTMTWPDGDAPAMPDRMRGLPMIDAAKCPDGCRDCAEACPTDAIEINGTMKLDLGKCLFCTDCVDACPEEAICYTQDYRLAVRKREDLIIDDRAFQLAESLEEKSKKLFGRSLQLRVVSAGGCNGCESDINVLNTVGWDLSRFGIHIVASPRHADGLIITGPVTENMKLALKKTYAAMPAPKIVIAIGACAISGGPFADHPQQNNGIGDMFPVDLYIPGCPPHPMTILDGLLRLLGRLDDVEHSGDRPASTG